MNAFMAAAIAEAEKGIHQLEGGPFGCVIVKDGRIIGRGHNQVIKNQDPTCHGEMMAIRDACHAIASHDLSGCDLYTTGEPCPMCFGAILWANIANVYYGCTVDDTRTIGFRDELFFRMSKEEKAKLMKELDRPACLRLYQEYKKITGETSY